MRQRLFVQVSLSIMLLSAVTACGSRSLSSSEPRQGTSIASPGAAASSPVPTAAASPAASSPAASSTAEPTPYRQKMKLYFADDQGEKLVSQESTITYREEKEKYLAALHALQKSEVKNEYSLCSGIKFKSAVLSKGVLTVDLSIPPEGQLGSSGEQLLLNALKMTLFQFEEVQSFNLLVDGKEVDSLMGHLDLPHPIKRTAK